MQTSIYVPTALVEEAYAFVLANRARHDDRSLDTPTIFCLEGPSGSGKTTAFKAIAATLNMHVEFVPSSALGGAYVGQSSVPVRDAIIRANAAKAEISAVLIDDFDTTEARVDDDLSNTINSPLLNATVMNYADNPFQLILKNDDQQSSEVFHLDKPPVIFMSCNDATKLYGPLRRKGRMQVEVLDPQGEEMVRVIRGMYPGLSREECQSLMEAFPAQSVAFFKDLGREAASAFIKEVARVHRPFAATGFAYAGFADALKKARANASLEELIAAGKRLSEKSEGRNYLRPVA